MKAVTVRNVPPEVARLIERRARQRKTSINKAVVELLAETAGLGKHTRPVLHHDLDHLAGVWSQREAAAFDQVLAEQRAIEPDVWR